MQVLYQDGWHRQFIVPIWLAICSNYLKNFQKVHSHVSLAMGPSGY